MTTAPTPYTLEQLAPGSYEVLLDGSVVAGLVRSVHRGGPGSEWQIVRNYPGNILLPRFASRAFALSQMGFH